jgi:uracil-DNA glycosylase
MKPAKTINCKEFPCEIARHEAFIVPKVEINPVKVKLIMIAECAPLLAADYFYSKGKSLFAETTLQALQDAGEKVTAIDDLMGLGIYLTTAVKCGKKDYSIAKDTIRSCSVLLEQELALFQNKKVILLMGDTAIYAINCIAKRNGQSRPIPVGSTYKIRGGTYEYNGVRLFPSYLQAGPSFYIEKSKRRMIAEDIAAGLKLIK